MKTGWHGKEGSSSFPPSSVPDAMDSQLGPLPGQEEGGAVSGKLTQEQAGADVGSPRSSQVPLQFTVTSSSMHTVSQKALQASPLK